jgi:hypothetical protein
MTERSDIHKSSIFNSPYRIRIRLGSPIMFNLIQLINAFSDLTQEFQAARLFTQMIAYKFFQKFRAFF